MNQLHTKDEQRFIDIAARLAGEFASRAARYDEEGAFPHENYASLRESGYSIMGIPEELGGLGATMLQRVKAQETLAQGCGATALAINMHFNVLGLMIDLERKFHAPNVTAMGSSRVAPSLATIGATRSVCDASSDPNTTAATGR